MAESVEARNESTGSNPEGHSLDVLRAAVTADLIDGNRPLNAAEHTVRDEQRLEYAGRVADATIAAVLESPRRLPHDYNLFIDKLRGEAEARQGLLQGAFEQTKRRVKRSLTASAVAVLGAVYAGVSVLTDQLNNDGYSGIEKSASAAFVGLSVVAGLAINQKIPRLLDQVELDNKTTPRSGIILPDVEAGDDDVRVAAIESIQRQLDAQQRDINRALGALRPASLLRYGLRYRKPRQTPPMQQELDALREAVVTDLTNDRFTPNRYGVEEQTIRRRVYAKRIAEKEVAELGTHSSRCNEGSFTVGMNIEYDRRYGLLSQSLERAKKRTQRAIFAARAALTGAAASGYSIMIDHLSEAPLKNHTIPMALLCAAAGGLGVKLEQEILRPLNQVRLGKVATLRRDYRLDNGASIEAAATEVTQQQLAEQAAEISRALEAVRPTTLLGFGRSASQKAAQRVTSTLPVIK